MYHVKVLFQLSTVTSKGKEDIMFVLSKILIRKEKKVQDIFQNVLLFFGRIDGRSD